MLGFKNRNNAFKENERAYKEHDGTVREQQIAIDRLNENIVMSCASLADSEGFLNNFTNAPLIFDADVARIRETVVELCGTDALKRKARNSAFARSAAGIGSAAAVVVSTQIAKTVLLKGTGLVIAKTALMATGTGVAAKVGLPMILGPAGWVLSGVMLGGSCYSVYRKNKKYGEQADDDTKKIKYLTEKTRERTLRAAHFAGQIQRCDGEVQSLAAQCIDFEHDYNALSEPEKRNLCELLNHSNILAGMIQRVVKEV
jgi:hypothetical protein